MMTIFKGKVKFAPKVGKASTGDEYVLLNVSKHAGKDAAGNAVFNEFHLAVWNQYDVELAKSLSAGDIITFGIDKVRTGDRLDEKTGKHYPFISGNVVSGELCAVYTNTPSPSLFAYEQAQQARREAAKMQREEAHVPTPTQPAAAYSTAGGLIQPVVGGTQYTGAASNVAVGATPVAPAPVAPAPVAPAPVAPAPVAPAPVAPAPAPVAPAPVAPAPAAPAPVAPAPAPVAPAPAPVAPAAPTVQAPMPPTAPPAASDDVALPPTAPAPAENLEIKRDIPF